MLYVEAPTEYEGTEPSVFLAGGITGCELWQPRMVELLSELDAVVCNPRQADFDVGNPTAAEAQISWEYRHLNRATAVLFWFPQQSICPIALYELGRCTAGERPLFVGVDPEYPRRRDVEIQLPLARSDVALVYSLKELAGQVIAHFS